MDNNNSNEIIKENDPDWGEDLEVQEVKNNNSSDDNWSDTEDDWSDDWGDFEFDDSEPEWETFDNTSPQTNSNNDIYYLDGYGQIYELDNYLNNGNGLIELLQHAKNKEQFNYILGMSKQEGHDENLLNYLISINYSVEDYISINVGYQIFQYKGLIEYLISKANNDQIKDVLSKIAYVDEKIANIVAIRDDRIELMESNYHLRDKIVSKKVIQFFKENPDKVDLEVINVCDLDTDIIREFINLGYRISENSPYDLLQNNDIMKEEFLKLIKINNSDVFNKLDSEINSIPGAYYMLYKSKTKEIFDEEFIKTFGENAVEQMIKYIVLGDYQIDLSKINSNNIKQIKDVYDSLINNNTFDINLFVNIIYKFNMNPNVFANYKKDAIDLNKLKIYFEFKELVINDINDINNIDNILYKFEQNKIESTNNIIDLKNIICNLLTNQTYFETKKGLLELSSKDKLSVLKNSIKDETKKKKIDSYIILSEFINKIDSIDNVEQLREIANVINQQILNNGINFNWIDFNKKVMNYYTFEANERMTDFNKYLTDTFYDATDFNFNDGTNVNGKRVKVAHIKSGEEFNSLIHVLNAYQNGGTTGSIESVLSPKFIGQSYISLTGISDEYSRICVNRDSRFSIKVLYSGIPSGDMFCASNRDTGITAKSNSKNIYTRLPSNMAPFRRLVRNTETHGSETYNEFDVFRDNLVPSGIVFMGNDPTEEEINAAAYLGVPLVKIDDLQESFRKDSFSISKGGLSYDQSFYNIKEHDYENQQILVSPNDKYDMLLNVIQDKIQTKSQESITIDSFSEKDELGRDEYFVMYNGEKYSATPVYEFADSKRINIETDYYEENLIKNKIYSYLDIQPRTVFINCKYPSGKELLSVIENTNEQRLIDKYIDYLVDVSNSKSDFDELSNFNINSLEELQLLNKINSIDNNSYIRLFESLIKANDYIEPNLMISNIILKKQQLNLVLTKFNELLNQSQISMDSGISDMFETTVLSENGIVEESHKLL